MIDINNAPSSVTAFLKRMEIIGRSETTVFQYYHDLRTFGRFLVKNKKISGFENTPTGEIDFESIPDELIAYAEKKDILEFSSFLYKDAKNNYAAINRKLATLRSYYKYMKNNHEYAEGEKRVITLPTDGVDNIKKSKRLPKFLTLSEAVKLLDSVSGANYERNYAIITLFLNCGLRVSELVGINIKDISFDQGSIRIIGKGNKERMIYLNEACVEAINAYLKVRPENVKDEAKKALFISRNRNRISVQTVQWVVYKFLDLAGFGNLGMSVHKLRHTAATLLYREGGVDVRTLKEILGHEELSTTQIYTHVSDEQMRMASENSPLASERGNKTKANKKKADNQPLSLNIGSSIETEDEPEE